VIHVCRRLLAVQVLSIGIVFVPGPAGRLPAQESVLAPGAAVLESCQATVVKLFGAGGGMLDAYGSGILVSSEGHVLTVWNHLVTTGFLTAVTADGRKFSVDVVGTSVDHDAALLKIKSRPGESFPFVNLDAAVDPEPGSPVCAFSNMYKVASGSEPVSVVHGIIAARVPLEATQGRWQFPVKSPVWLIDAVVNNSGAAGGLLTDTAGRPVGLIGREIRHSSSRTWVNYAVPLTILRPVVEKLREGRGLPSSTRNAEPPPSLTDLELTKRFGLTLIPEVVERTPAWIDDVRSDSAAAAAGLQRGDLIVLLDDRVITDVTDIGRQFAAAKPGQRIRITINRDEQLVLVELRVP
jgi:serine protease Do